MPASKKSVFAPGLEAHLASGNPVSPARSFREYAEEHGLDAQRTASYISVSHWGELPQMLQAADTMVLRLGGPGPTRFSLVTVSDVTRFFVPEPDPALNTETFLPRMSLRALFSYAVLGSVSEQTLITLASTSGLLSHALGLDPDDPLEAPATGAITATFAFRPDPEADTVLHHVGGQVEVDAVFVGRRDGRDVVFVIEAKGRKPRLAKHKLVYPILSLRENVPEDMEVIPIYLRAFRDRSRPRFIFEISEGAFAGKDDPPYLTAISFAPYRRLALPLPGF